MSHDDYRDNHHNNEHRRKKFGLPRKALKLLLEGAGLLIGALALGFVALVVGNLAAPATDMLEAITNSWQSVLDWFKPLTDLYNQTIKLIPALPGE